MGVIKRVTVMEHAWEKDARVSGLGWVFIDS